MTQERLAGWEGEVVVTQADRDAALEAYYSCYGSTPNELWMNALIAGKHDDDPQVQLLARHRLATIEECAKVAAEWSSHLHSERWSPEAHDASEFIATAIRSLAPPPAVVGEGK